MHVLRYHTATYLVNMYYALIDACAFIVTQRDRERERDGGKESEGGRGRGRKMASVMTRQKARHLAASELVRQSAGYENKANWKHILETSLIL